MLPLVREMRVNLASSSAVPQLLEIAEDHY